MPAQVVALTLPFTLALLKAEINNALSPLHSAYGAHPNPGTSAADEIAIAALLNDPTNAGGGPIPGDPISPAAFRSCFDPTDVLNISQAQNGAMLFQFGLADNMDVGNPRKQAIINALLAGYPTSLAQIQATYTMAGSRAQVLWGKTVPAITDSMVQQAAVLP